MIRKITLKDFGVFGNFDLDIPEGSRILGFMGPNASGKTTLFNALELLATGKPRCITHKNQLSSMIRTGAKKAEIIIEEETITRRALITKSKYDVNPPPSEQAAIAFTDFLALSSRERKTFLFDLLGSTITTDPWKILQEMIGIERGKLPDDIIDLIEEGDYEKACTVATECRRAAKRDIQEIPAIPNSTVIVKNTSYDLNHYPLDTMQDRLRALRKNRDETRDVITQLESLASITGGEDPAKVIKKCKAMINASQDEIKEREKIARQEEAEIELVRQELEVADREIRGMNDEQYKIQQAIKNPPETCPLFNVPCKSRDDIMAAQGAMKDKIETLIQAIKEKRGEIEDLQIQIETTKKSGSESQKYVAILKDQIRECENMIARLDGITATGNLAEAEKALGEIEDHITLAEGLIEKKRIYESAVAQQKTATTGNARAEKEVEFYDKLTRALEPDGLPSKMLQAVLQSFQDNLNVGAYILGPDIKLFMTSELSIIMNTTPEGLLSESERFRLNILLRATISKLAGCKTLLIDRVDILDQDNKAALIDLIISLAPDFEAILFFATVSEKPETPPAELGMTFYYLPDLNGR